MRRLDLDRQRPIRLLPRTLGPAQPGVVPAARHLHHAAHGRDGELLAVLTHESVSHGSSFEKIPTALLRMSRSIVSRLFSRRSRINSSCSSGVSRVPLGRLP